MTNKDPEFDYCPHCKQDKPYAPMGICGFCLANLCEDCLKANPCRKAGKKRAIKGISTTPPMVLDHD